jgi:serine/threonine protein kinase/serine/threonine protein phosphatase PrpC
VTQTELDIACFSEAGIKPVNEDAVGFKEPTESYACENKGVSVAIADGVSTAEAGREASHTAVERFLEEYYQTPDTWSVSGSGEKILSTINLRLFRQSHEFTTTTKGYLCTFSAVVIKSRTLHFFHVGDSRIYLLREGVLKQLTTDHVAVIDHNRSCLSRAIGMDSRLNLDYGHSDIRVGDRLLLTTDGVHDFVDCDQLKAILAEDSSATEIVGHIQAAAAAAETNDNFSAAALIVKSLPESNLQDYSAKLTRLPFPPDLQVGMKLDGYRVIREIFASSRSQLYLVRDEMSEDGEDHYYAMKTPSRNIEEDLAAIDRFIQEEWIGRRIHSPHVVRVIQQQRSRTALYYLMEYVDGIGLDTWIDQHQPPSPKQSIAIVKQIAEGLKAFHNNEAIHQDLKPANIVLCKQSILAADPEVLIIDFGSVYVAGLAELQRPLIHEGALGTASYSDPLYLLGRNPGIQGDVYALATISYEIFTGHLPYGDEIDECHSAIDYDRLRYTSASQHNPQIPLWFDAALEKGVAFDLQQRYLTIDNLLTDITQPNPLFLQADPVVEKNASSLTLWKLLSGFWFLTFLLVIYLFSRI